MQLATRHSQHTPSQAPGPATKATQRGCKRERGASGRENDGCVVATAAPAGVRIGGERARIWDRGAVRGVVI